MSNLAISCSKSFKIRVIGFCFCYRWVLNNYCRCSSNLSYSSVLLEVLVIWQFYFCFLDIKPEISATVLECIAKIRPCYRSASATFLERPWSNYTALNAWTSTLPSLQDTITPMGHISALVSHTCFLWCIQNIGKGMYIPDMMSHFFRDFWTKHC
mgnify:CR=1 FL=1